MKIWIAPYSLNSKAQLNRHQSITKHEGFLIKLQSKEFAAGYADCRPWDFLGDGSVQQQVQSLKDRKWTPLLRRSLFFATIDGRARAQGQSLWDDKISLKSHYTCVDLQELSSPDTLEELREQGYRTIKIKMGKSPVDEVRSLNRLAEKSWFRWRLDFNGKGGDDFLKQASSTLLTQIDVIEDPAPYNEEAWKSWEAIYGVKFAYDQAQPVLYGRAPRVQVIKPARQNWLARPMDIITNSLDHPVGQSFAALQAQESVKKNEGQKTLYGLKTDHLFESTPYMERLRSSSCLFQPDRNLGIGFHDLLQRETWIPL